MEVEKITIKVGLAGVVVQAVAVLTDQGRRTKESDAGVWLAWRTEVVPTKAPESGFPGTDRT